MCRIFVFQILFNPIKYIPALVDGDIVVSDSLAISLYLEDKYPAHPLLPKDPKRKALNLQVISRSKPICTLFTELK